MSRTIAGLIRDANANANLYAPCHVEAHVDTNNEYGITGLTIYGADDTPLWYVDLVIDDRPGKPDWAYTVEYVSPLQGAKE